MKDHFGYKTIRCTSCEVFVEQSALRCDPCKAYRKILNSMLSRQQRATDQSPTQPDSHANFRYLNTPQRKKRIERLHVCAKVCQQRVKRLRERLDRAIEERGVEVDADLHDDLIKTMNEENTLDLVNQYDPDSFQRIFWEQQQQAMKKKDSRSMRWEPAMIRFV